MTPTGLSRIAFTGSLPASGRPSPARLAWRSWTCWPRPNARWNRWPRKSASRWPIPRNTCKRFYRPHSSRAAKRDSLCSTALPTPRWPRSPHVSAPSPKGGSPSSSGSFASTSVTGRMPSRSSCTSCCEECARTRSSCWTPGRWPSTSPAISATRFQCPSTTCSDGCANCPGTRPTSRTAAGRTACTRTAPLRSCERMDAARTDCARDFQNGEQQACQWRLRQVPDAVTCEEERCLLIFRPYYTFDRGCAAYVLGCATMGLGAWVDPRADHIDSYAIFAADKGLRLTHVIDTHAHADHRSGGQELARRTGALYCLHESAQMAVPFTPLHDHDVI